MQGRRYDGGYPGDPNLRLKVVTGMALVSVVLLYLLAYTLGSGVQESKDVQAQTGLEDQVKVIRGRLKLCQSVTLKQAAHLGKNELDVETLRAENDLLERENTLLQGTNDDLEKTALECEEDSQNEKDHRTGAGEASVVDVIERMRFENKNLEAEKNAINATNRQHIQGVNDGVKAYRLENRMLRKQLIQQREKEELAARATPQPTAAEIKGEVKAERKSDDAEAEAPPRPAQAVEAVAMDAPPPPVVAPPAPCTDSNEACAAWAAKDECKRNPTFMSRTCRKSCGDCPPPSNRSPSPARPRNVEKSLERRRERDPDEGGTSELDAARRKASRQLGFSED